MKKEDDTPLQGEWLHKISKFDMMDSFLMDQEFPTFKVECIRLGYVDDLTRWTHERCYDERILEWCLGYNTQTRKQECGIFQMDQ